MKSGALTLRTRRTASQNLLGVRFVKFLLSISLSLLHMAFICIAEDKFMTDLFGRPKTKKTAVFDDSGD